MNLRRAIRQYFALPVVGQLPANLIAQGLGFEGAMADPGALVAALGGLQGNGIAGDQMQFATTAGTTLTMSNLQNLIQRLTAGSAVTVTLDSAYNIVNNLVNPFNGQTFGFIIVTNASTTVATPTLSDTAVTLSGTTTVLAAAARWYQAQITAMSTTVGMSVTAGTTFTSLTQVGTTNNFTVALGTNTISPTVGNAILLTGITGTLPNGWYPINKVSSATSFVIATPQGTTWTATAATVPGTTVIPPSAYTPGLPGLYSPTMTITGVMATVTATMSV